MRAAVPAVVAVAAAACWGAPPTPRGPAPAPLEDGTRAAPYVLKPGVERHMMLDTIVVPPATFAVDERADVVLVWTGGRGFSLTDADGISSACETSPHVLPLADAGGYAAELRGDDDTDQTKPIHVTVRALPPPEPVALELGKKLVLRPAPITADDPRGPIADARLHVDEPGYVELTVRATGSKSTDLTELSALIGLEVFGPRGTVMTLRGVADGAPGSMTIGFDVGAGDYLLRASGGNGRASTLELASVPLGPTVNPVVERAPRPVSAESPRVRVGADLDVVVAEAPAAPRTWLDIPGGHDLALAWKPTDVELGVDRENMQSACDPTPCVLVRPDAGWLAISARPGDRHVWVDVRARLLALPLSAGTLHAGESLDVATRPITDGDPRGPIAEVIVVADQPGTYDVTAQDRAWTPPADWRDAKLPQLEVRTIDGAWAPTANLLTSSDEIRDGIGRTMIEVETPGRFIVRLDGTGAGAPRSLHVAVTRVDDADD